MEKVEKIQCGISQKEGYRYVWDEATNFIVYQNDEGKLIIGMCPHAEKISESEIKKLYEIYPKSYKIKWSGSGIQVNFKHAIYPKNFFSLTDDKKLKEEIRIKLTKLHPYFFSYREKKEEKVEFSREVEINKGYDGSTEDNPVYWTFDNDDHKSISYHVDNIIYDILDCLYSIGITRMYYSSYNNDNREDIFNKDLLRVIRFCFAHNRFNVVEEREEDYTILFDKAHEENKIYDECVNSLNKFIQKLIEEQDEPGDIAKACEDAMLYKKITGERYPFRNNIYSELESQVDAKRKDFKN